MKRLLGNVVLLAVATLSTLVLAEIGLRKFTPFPIHGERANKVPDDDLGYRLNPRHKSIDEKGFRNSGDHPRLVAAIGDSHTYGSNVSSEKSWPAQFEELTDAPTYNFGVSSYGVYTYYALARKAIDAGYKHLIIALFIQNDFKGRGNACLIDFAGSPIWKSAVPMLDLTLPKCSANRQTLATSKFGFWQRLLHPKRTFATVSAIDYLVIRPMRDWWFFDTSGPETSDQNALQAKRWGLIAQKEDHIRRGLVESDLSNPETLAIAQDFEKMLRHLKSLAGARGVTLGVLLVPSKVRVAQAVIGDEQAFSRVPWMWEMSVNQTQLEQRMLTYLEQEGIPSRSALGEMIAAVGSDGETLTEVYRSDDGHPLAKGYLAYATAAEKLFQEMRARGPMASR
ncbi:MAG: hypothetical protein AAGF14_04680 [Pseudomonadota bacterium]